ncbi:MAG: hypothetical protein KatS3mg039_1382 [Candidatus Kapaibacterium sp.]|nr:MAG: hypothetical protein KatS3mg039_1382 [Candidatus Kapabacteria bacterium]
MRVLACFILFALCLDTATVGQTLRFVRTDPTTNPTVVTATKLFGLDVVASNISNVTAVSFELRYTGAQYIRLAAWKARELSRQSVYVIDRSDTVTGIGSIAIGVLSGEPTTGVGLDSPTVVHLDFVVLPNSPHRTLVQFDAQNAEAVVAGAPPQLVPLGVEPLALLIHSFVWVFPGDANNDGRVDQRDYSTVALYLGQGTASGVLRGYRRRPASTRWEPQRALAWDDENATYADCDGSGDITLADALVVSLNFDSTHAVTLCQKDYQPPFAEPVVSSPLAARITVHLPTTDVQAIALELGLPPNLTLDGITPAAESTWRTEFFRYDATTGRALCVIGCIGRPVEPTVELRLLAQQEQITAPPVMVSGYALLQSSRSIVPIEGTVASVQAVADPRRVGVFPQPATTELIIVAPEASRARLYTQQGQLLDTIALCSGSTRYALSALDSGLYWLVTDDAIIPVLIAR